MRDFKEARLIDITIGNGTYGIAAPAVPKDNNKYTYLRITDINDDGSLNFSDLKSVDDPKANKYLLKPNDIVFARTGNSTGRSYFYDGSAGELVYAGFLIKFSLDSHKVNPKILKYYTHSKNYYDWVASFDSGATRGNINAKTFAEMPITLPPRNIQDKIVAILSALDEKIETNRKINARLEELAQALFKSWFIDFEPFGGQMPEDWKNVTLSDIGDIIGGATPSKEHSEYYAKVGNGIAWLTPKDLSETNAKFTARGSLDITNLGYQKCSTKLIPCGSILFSSRAPIGYVSIALNEICTNQGFKSFIPKQVGTAFSYYLLKTLTPEIENKSTGSTFKEASGSLMKSLQVFLPDKETLSRFEEICTPIFDKQRDCEIESARLAELRDSLLPKLMSGELIPE